MNTEYRITKKKKRKFFLSSVHNSKTFIKLFQHYLHFGMISWCAWKRSVEQTFLPKSNVVGLVIDLFTFVVFAAEFACVSLENI